jgi:hypothetical protein
MTIAFEEHKVITHQQDNRLSSALHSLQSRHSPLPPASAPQLITTDHCSAWGWRIAVVADDHA